VHSIASGRVLFGMLVLLSAMAGRVPAQDRSIEAAVSEALERYSTALESLDASSVKKIQPSIDVESLKKAFGQMRTLEVTIADLKVLSTDAAIVRVSCKVTQTLTPKVGSKQTTTVNRVVRLKRVDTGLVIDAFER
jgi:flavin-binding protein dodecin